MSTATITTIQPQALTIGGANGEHYQFSLDQDQLVRVPVREASELQDAIEHAWQEALNATLAWKPDPKVNYPVFQGDPLAWPKSEVAIAPVVQLPAFELEIDKPIYLPQCVSLVGPGKGMGGTNIRFHGNGCLRVLGNLRTDTMPFHQVRGHVHGIKFVGASDKISPVQLWGDLANWHFTNNHVIRVNARNCPGVQHVNAYQADTPFGPIITQPRGGHTLKEVDISHNQFEGFSASVSVSGATNCFIKDNKFVYMNLGVEARNCRNLFIQGNSFKGARTGESIQPGDQAGIIGSGHRVAIVSNHFTDLDLGVAWRGKDNENGLIGNVIQGVPRGRQTDWQIDGRWRSPKDFGTFNKGAKPPYAVD